MGKRVKKKGKKEGEVEKSHCPRGAVLPPSRHRGLATEILADASPWLQEPQGQRHHHLTYNLVLQQWGSTGRTTGWSWARRGEGEMEGTGMSGADGNRRDGKQQKKVCQGGGGELKGCHRLKTFTLMGCDRFNFQSTTIKVMDGRRSSRAWRARALRGCRRVCFVAVIYEVVSTAARHSSSAGGTGEETRLMLGELGC